MHRWNDDWFKKYGEDLYVAERWIITELKKRTWCQLISKEKYGTIRYGHVVPPKGHVYMFKYAIRAPWKKRTKYGTYRPVLFAWNDCWLYRRWQWYAWKKLWVIVQEAAEKWPHLKRELESDIASHEELVGSHVHSQYWRSLK